MPHHLIYLSRATQPFSDANLLDLLTQARSYNASQDISGLLVYGNGQFLQVLEGEEAPVRALYEHIRRDPRHRDAVTFADKDIPARAFAGWGMAFQPVSAAQFEQLVGYLAPAELAFGQQGLSAVDEQLLHTLRGFVLG